VAQCIFEDYLKKSYLCSWNELLSFLEPSFNIHSCLHFSEQKHTAFSNDTSWNTRSFKQIFSPQLLQAYLKSENATFLFIMRSKQYYRNNLLLKDEIKISYQTFLKYMYIIKVLKKHSVASAYYFKYTFIYLSFQKIILSPNISKNIY
jgi:hypothetical protein